MISKTVLSAQIKECTWGYWVGWILVATSLLAAGLGVYSLARASKEKIKMVSAPGESELNLKMPGVYMGILSVSGNSTDEIKRGQELEYLMVDAQTQEPLTIDKIPPAAYASAQLQKQVPLFQVAVPKAGQYVLSTNYPYYLDGPHLNVLLLNTDMGYVVREVIVSAIVSLIFLFLSCWLFIRTHRQRNPKK